MNYKVKATGQIGKKVGETTTAIELLLPNAAHEPTNRQWFTLDKVEATAVGTKLQPAINSTPGVPQPAASKPVVKKAAVKKSAVK